MKYTQSEKMELIRMVEDSSQSVQQTLQELDVPRSSFYKWYRRYMVSRSSSIKTEVALLRCLLLLLLSSSRHDGCRWHETISP
jgi:transposase-like protein